MKKLNLGFIMAGLVFLICVSVLSCQTNGADDYSQLAENVTAADLFIASEAYQNLEKEIRKNIRRKQNVISKWSKEEKERYLQFKTEWFNPKIRTEANIQLNLLLGYDEEANYDRISSLVGEVYEGTDFTQLELMKALQKRQMKRVSISTRTTDTEELEICNRACTDHAIQRSIICFDIYNAAMSSLESMAEHYNPEDIRSEKEKLAAERKECLEDVDKTREECLESCKDSYGK